MSAPPPTRKPRADSQRNRERLIAAAKAGFTEKGAEVSLEEVARRAEVGIGTLYRHFPTRETLIEAVYRREVQNLGEAADRLAAEAAPAEALRRWMVLFIDYIATKKVIAATLESLVGGGSDLYAASSVQITGAVTRLVEAAAGAGQIRPDTQPDDVLRALVGFAYGHAQPGWRESALRLVEILMAGLRPPGR